MTTPEFHLLTLAALATQALALLFRDALWLRLGLVASNAVTLAAYYLDGQRRDEALWLWAFLFINVVHSVLLLRDRQSLRWTNEELELRQNVFQRLSPREFKKLMRMARWRTFNPGQILVDEGHETPRLILLYSGGAIVQVRDKTVARLRHYSFVGEMSFLTGAPASATVKTAQTARCLVWEAKALRQALLKSDELRAAMRAAFSHDLLGKLAHTEQTEQTDNAETNDLL